MWEIPEDFDAGRTGAAMAAEPGDPAGACGKIPNDCRRDRLTADFERAKRHANLIDFSMIRRDEDGCLTLPTQYWFVGSLPWSERVGLIDEGDLSGEVAVMAEAAIIARGYESDRPLRLRLRSLGPEAKVIMDGLGLAAPAASKLAGLPDGFDIRGIIVNAAVRSARAEDRGEPLENISRQYEFGTPSDDREAVNAVIDLFARNLGSAKAIGSRVTAIAEKLFLEAGSSDAPLFRDLEKTPEDAVQTETRRMSPAAERLWSRHIDALMAWLLEDGRRPDALRPVEPMTGQTAGRER